MARLGSPSAEHRANLKKALVGAATVGRRARAAINRGDCLTGLNSMLNAHESYGHALAELGAVDHNDPVPREIRAHFERKATRTSRSNTEIDPPVRKKKVR